MEYSAAIVPTTATIMLVTASTLAMVIPHDPAATGAAECGIKCFITILYCLLIVGSLELKVRARIESMFSRQGNGG